MKTSSNMEKHSYSTSKLFYFVILMLVFSIPFSSLSAADRFSPPSFNNALVDFNNRTTSSDSINIDFIVAQVLNNARQIERAGERFKRDALLFSNQNQSNQVTNYTGFGASSNSVIIPPGTRADTIIIINKNEGDSYAIDR